MRHFFLLLQELNKRVCIASIFDVSNESDFYIFILIQGYTRGNILGTPSPMRDLERLAYWPAFGPLVIS